MDENNKKILNNLYRVIICKRINLTVEDIESYINKGAILHNLLYLCILCWSPPEIIKYLINKGAKDSKYGTLHSIFYHREKEFVIDIDNIVIYATIKNAILQVYHMCIGSRKLDIEVAIAYGELTDKKWLEIVKDEIYKNPSIELVNQLENIKKYCELLGIDFNSLHDNSLELPENLEDYSIIPDWDFDCV